MKFGVKSGKYAMERLITNEIFIIFISFAFLERPMKKFGDLDDITKMKEIPRTSLYIKRFRAGLQNVETGWSAIVVTYAVLNVVLLIAILSGSGPFRIVLRPSLVYPELITNVAILLGNRLACGVLPMKNPKLMACALSTAAKIIGIAMGIIRWILTFWLWWSSTCANPTAAAAPEPLPAEAPLPEVRSRVRQSMRSVSVMSAGPPPPLRASGSGANFRRLLRRRMTKSMASESRIVSQLSRLPFLSEGRGFDVYRPCRSANSILDSMIVEDWEGEAWDQPPAVRARRCLSSAAFCTPTTGVPEEVDGVGEGGRADDWSKEREVIRRACHVICIAMAPESVVMGWQQAPKNAPKKKAHDAYYDDWRGLLREARALHAHRERNDIIDEYGLLDSLCDKVLEYRFGPKLSHSAGSIEDEDDPASYVMGEVPWGLTPGERAAEVLRMGEEPKGDRRGDSLDISERDRLVSVESFLFAKFADTAKAKSFAEAVRPSIRELSGLSTIEDESSRTSKKEDKGVQVNTLSVSALRKFYDQEDDGSGLRPVSSRDAFAQVSTLPARYLEAKAA